MQHTGVMHSHQQQAVPHNSDMAAGKGRPDAPAPRQGRSTLFPTDTAFGRTLMGLLLFSGFMIMLAAYGAVSWHSSLHDMAPEPVPHNMLPAHVLQQVAASRSLNNSGQKNISSVRGHTGQRPKASDADLASSMAAARQVLEARDFHLLHLLRGFSSMLASGSLPSAAAARAAYRSALDAFNTWGVFEPPAGLVKRARDDEFSLWLLQAFTYISATGTVGACMLLTATLCLYRQPP